VWTPDSPNQCPAKIGVRSASKDSLDRDFECRLALPSSRGADMLGDAGHALRLAVAMDSPAGNRRRVDDKECQHESTISPCKYGPGHQPAALMERQPGQAGDRRIRDESHQA